MLNAITSYVGYRPIIDKYDMAHYFIHIIMVTRIFKTTIVPSFSDLFFFQFSFHFEDLHFVILISDPVAVYSKAGLKGCLNCDNGNTKCPQVQVR